MCFKMNVFCSAGDWKLLFYSSHTPPAVKHNYAYSQYSILLLFACCHGGVHLMCLYLALVAWCWQLSTWRDNTSSEIYAWAAVSPTWSRRPSRPGWDPSRWHRAACRHPRPFHPPEGDGKRAALREREREKTQDGPRGASALFKSPPGEHSEKKKTSYGDSKWDTERS